LHEFGHYWPAKYFKIKVEKFYLFFDVNFSLFKKKIGETEWGIGWLPLGGYVKIAGMIDESMDKEQMAKPPKSWEFRSKPSWQRLIVMLGGVTINFILAIIIYIGLAYSYGSSSISLDSIDDGFEDADPILTEAGFKTGDKIIIVDGQELETYSDLRKSIIGSTYYQVERDGNIFEIQLPVDFLGKLSSSEDMSSFEFRMPFIIQSVSEESLNKDYDIRQGDRIVSVNGQETKYVDQLVPLLEQNSNRTIEVELLRDTFRIKKTLNVNEDGKLGIMHGATVQNMVDLGLMKFSNNSYSFLQSIGVGTNNFISFMGFYFDQLVAIFNPSTGAYKGLGGFIAIGNIFPSTWDWQSFWNTTALLSVMLGVLNLFCIPALDGGHAMFLVYEMVSGRKPSDKCMETVQVIGFLILLALVIFANGNDIYKLFNFIV
jgi:regulator of sigma E protease